jgi:hypothetical protein
MPEEIVEQPQQQVDRARRSKFIFRVTAFCLITMALLAILSGFGVITAGPVVELYMRSVSTLALTAVGAYVTGSVVDYNGGFGNLFSSKPEG